MAGKTVKVGLLGLGTVGGGVAQLLAAQGDRFRRRLGAKLALKTAVDLNPKLVERSWAWPPGVYSSGAQGYAGRP